MTRLSQNEIILDGYAFLYWVISVTSIIFVFLVMPLALQLSLYVLILVVFILYADIDISLHSRRDISIYLTIPVFISAFQNIYMGLIAPFVASEQIMAFLTMNVFYSFLLLCYLLVKSFNVSIRDKLAIEIAGIFFLLGIAALVSFLLHGGSVFSAIASYRNIMAPLFFFLLGVIASQRVFMNRFIYYLSIIGWIVIIFGVLERYFIPDFWKLLNIGALWTMKGLYNLPIDSLPYNFYSSERIGGMQLRRMASTFADPVNLGVFLFLVSLIAWYSKRFFLMFFALVAIALAVSKGALLGVLCFLSVWSYYSCNRLSFVFLMFFSILSGVFFIVYSLEHSTQSLFVHFLGFVNTFKELPSHLFGFGLGRVGVISSHLGLTANPQIKESGIGLIVGQLGIVGLVLYICFIGLIISRILGLSRRRKILGFSLLLSIGLNIFFNEVALSPNSCVGYFTILGIICSTVEKERGLECTC